METILKCTAPGCGFCGLVEAMWLPSGEALRNANGGKAVRVEDFPQHALCSKHGHLLRKSEVRVYRYAASVDWEKQRAEKRDRRKTAGSQWNSFVGRYIVPARVAVKQSKGP